MLPLKPGTENPCPLVDEHTANMTTKLIDKLPIPAALSSLRKRTKQN